MKVIYPICSGVDAHKTFLVGTIISTTCGVQPHYHKKRFSTYNSDLHRFADWLHTNNCLDVYMESTDKYWVSVFNFPKQRGIRVTIVTQKWVKAVKGNKDNTKYSKWIGDLFRLGLVPGSFIPSKNIRILREFTRYRYKLVSMKSSEKNVFKMHFPSATLLLILWSRIYSGNLQLQLQIIQYPLLPSIRNTAFLFCNALLKSLIPCLNPLKVIPSQMNESFV